jgi:hypothetical protein
MKWKPSMNDEFFKQFYEEPRPEFAEALYERISRAAQPRLAGILPQRLTFRNAVIALAFLFFIAACVYAVSEKRWNKVGGIWVDVQRTIKVHVDPSEAMVVEPPEDECVTVEEAREILRFRFKVPAWAPAGFTFSNEICSYEDLSLSFSSPYLIWEGADKNTPVHLSLYNLKQFNSVTQKYEVGSASTLMYGMSVPPGSYEEVQVHGQPAVLVRGDWNWEDAPWATGETFVGEYEYKWDQKRALQLYWVDGEVFYRLYTNADVSAEDLIRMAESAQ